MAVGDVYKMAVVSTATGSDDIVNTFHYRQEVPSALLSNPAFLFDGWNNSVKEAYLHCFSARFSLKLVEIRQVTGGTEGEDFSVTDNGTLVTSDVLPLTDSPVISWRTGQIGRRKRGRSYMPTIPESYQDQGALTPDMVLNLETFAEAAMQITLLGVPQWQMVVFSPENLTADPPRPGTLITPVTAFVVAEILGIQRRRRQGRGS